jgi:hypothetical protein
VATDVVHPTARGDRIRVDCPARSGHASVRAVCLPKPK